MSAYRERVTTHLQEIRFPSVILDLILDFLVSGRRDHQVFAETVYIPEFDFLYEERKWAATDPKWKGNVAIVADQVLTNDLSKELFSSLQKISKPPLVFNEAVCKLTEIDADQIRLDPEFFSMISAEIQTLAQTLGHTTQVAAKLRTLMMFKTEDYFDTHIDIHNKVESVVFTTFVELKVNEWRSHFAEGHLVVDKDTISGVRDGQVGVTLFHHNQPHSVSRVKDGSRLFLVFDVADLGIPNPEFVGGIDAWGAFSKVLSQGFNNIALQSSCCSSPIDQVSIDLLRGSEKVFCEAALATGARRVEVCLVYERDHELFSEALLELMQLDYGFQRFYHKPGEESGDEEEEEEKEEPESANDGDEEEEQEGGGKRIKRAEPTLSRPWRSQFDPLPFPKYGGLVAVREEYRLGNTLFLATRNVPTQLKYIGKSDHGNISSSLAIIARF